MEDNTQYNVVSSGKVIEEFDLLEVQDSVAKLFKISPEQASSIVGKKKVLKKDLQHKDAQIYKRKLESLGLEIVLKPKEVKVVAPLSLSLEPIEGESPEAEYSPKAIESNPNITCEKCQLEQPKAEQCHGCGVFFHKIQSEAASTAPNTSRRESKVKAQEAPVFSGDALKLSGIVVGVITAVLGALLWKGIVIAFEYELGLVAWGIGGAIGFAVAFTGSKGQASGVMCGVLAVMAIMGGKYLVMEGYQEQLKNMLSTSAEEMRSFYDEERELAQNYERSVKGNQSLRQFMVDHDYSEYYETNRVTDEEIAYFKESIEPDFEALTESDMSFEKWYGNTIQVEVDNFSTIDMMKEDFGLIDALFLFLGVGTAFRLGRGEDRFA